MPALICDAFQLSLVSALLKESTEASLPEVLSEQPVQIRGHSDMTSSDLKKKAQANKSFLSWTISLRCAKAKG